MPPEADLARAAAFRERLGLDSLIDVHTHFMPERLLAAVRAYFDAAGPLIGRPWPIVYRQDEQTRVAALRAFGVRAFTALLYPHKPGMARSLNEWGAGFAARTPDCLHSATFFAEPSAAADVRRALDQGARVFKCHIQVGDFDPNDPLLDEAWGLLAEAVVPVVTHCGSGPVPGRFTGPGPVGALLKRHPELRLVVAHLGTPEYAEFLALAERHDRVLLDTTCRSPRSARTRAAVSPRPSCPGCGISVTACCSVPTSRTSRTRIRMPLRRWKRRASARHGCAPSAMTTPRGCSPGDRDLTESDYITQPCRTMSGPGRRDSHTDARPPLVGLCTCINMRQAALLRHSSYR